MEEPPLSGGAMKRIIEFIKSVGTSQYLSLVLRVYLGWIFINASLSKIPDPALFAENVANYRLVPYWGIDLVAVILPWLELICGFYMIIGLRIKATAALIMGLFSMFTLFVIINILRGTKMNCGCFDTVGEPIGWKKVLENTAWLLMTIQVFFFDRIHFFRSRDLVFWKKGKVRDKVPERSIHV